MPTPLTTLNALHAELRRHFEYLAHLRCDDIEVAGLISTAMDHTAQAGEACQRLQQTLASPIPTQRCNDH